VEVRPKIMAVTVAMIVLVLGGGPARAATIVQQLDFRQGATVNSLAPPCSGTTDETRNCFHRFLNEGESVGSIDGFDNSLGTLTAISFDTMFTIEFQTRYVAHRPPWTPQTTTASIFFAYETTYSTRPLCSSRPNVLAAQFSGVFQPLNKLLLHTRKWSNSIQRSMKIGSGALAK
jgi:hypothetical protein